MSADPKDVIRHLEGAELKPVSDKRLTEFQIVERRARWAALQTDGMRLTQIAEQEGLDVSRISRGVTALVRAHEERGLKSIEERKARAMAKLEMLEDEVLDAYYRGLAGKTVTYSEEVKAAIHKMNKKERKKGQRPSGGGTGKYKRYTRQEVEHGNERLLRLLLSIQQEMNKLEGNYPKPDEIKPDDLALLDPEKRAAMAASLFEQARLNKARRLSQEEGQALHAGSIEAHVEAPSPQGQAEIEQARVEEDAVEGPGVEAPEEVKREDIDTSLKPEI